ncbi:MAG: ATP-dependent DNA helicase RecG [Acidobacteria bacterium]|nr:ATP-dependent DNA helicase RecG [Acidobacteriota bacterium]
MSAPANEDVLATPLQFLKGVGEKRAADLARVGLHTLEDLLFRFPRRYEDRSRLLPIASVRPGIRATLTGRIVHAALRTTRRRGFMIFEVILSDDSGSILLTWLNQKFLTNVLKAGQHIVVYGLAEMRGHGGLQITNPEFEHLDEEEGGAVLHTGRIVPVYERAGTVTPKLQRKIVFDALARLPADLFDPVPEALRSREGLPTRYAALHATHFPPSDVSLEDLNRFRTSGQRRLIFEEAFLFQLGVAARRRSTLTEPKSASIVVTDATREAARQVLPFKLTAGQRTALKEIVDDLQKPHPMNRLLQGDVGAGKTIVALLAAVVAMENHLQVAFMAPTEILAEQHFATISRLLAGSRFRVALLTGSTTAAARRQQRAEIASGAIHLLVGTHALVQDDVSFHRLGFVIIDEQHRFGVMQRAMLREKGLHPDVLVMTATPIPRTLALTLYGDLDCSAIRDKPPGRTPVKTLMIPDARRDEVHRFLQAELEAGRQAYVIYPLVEESEKIDLKAATEMADTLAHEVFPQFRVGLLHGKMKADAKDRVMKAFAAGEIDLLVSTTVIEVGIDVPNATVMVVEHAERFGLSQLHQLRGRVGRGTHASHCLLVYQTPMTPDAKERLTAMVETTDGFEIAERDLRLRGAGDFFGTRQAGMPTFRLIDLVRDRELLELAQREAERWFGEAAPNARAVGELLRSWSARFRLMEVG